jgi:hypothetical protein
MMTNFRFRAAHCFGWAALWMTVVAAANWQLPQATAGYIDNVLATPNLVATWRLGEATGPTAVEVVGTNANANNGTYVNTVPSDFGQPGLLTGDANTAVKFNGSTSYVDAGNDASLNAAWSGVTMAAWVNQTNSGGVQMIAGKWNNTVANDHMGIFLYNGQLIGAVGDGSSAANGHTGTAVLSTNQRHFVAFTWQAGSGLTQLYVDGVLDPILLPGTLSTSMNAISAKNFFIGAQSPGFRHFDGIIDEVSVFNRALSAGEISSLYQVGFAGPPAPAPEPGSMVLLAGGLCVLASRRRRARTA